MAKVADLKEISKTHGTSAGDQLLISAARLFLRVFRQEDIVSRYGEDEFAVLLPNSDQSSLIVVMDRIQKQLMAYNQKHTRQPMHILFGSSTTNQGESLKGNLKLAKSKL